MTTKNLNGMVHILGIHIGHDATACIVNEKGEIVAAVAEERLTRVKYVTGFPYRAIEEVLRLSDLDKKDIDIVASATETFFHPSAPFIEEYFLSDDLDMKKSHDLFNQPATESKIKQIAKLVVKNITPQKERVSSDDYIREAKQYTEEVVRAKLNELGFSHARLETVEHHHTHAASAYYTSGMDDALILTIDGAGDGYCATASIVEDGKIKRISAASAACSPGRFYSEITRFVGFKRNRHEGKITGLAAYGDSNKYYDQLKRFLKFNPETESFEYETNELSAVKRKLDTLIRIINNENFSTPHIDEFHAFLGRHFSPKEDMSDLAAATQRIAEEVAVEYALHFLKKTGKRNVLLAGGLFANVRINQEISELEEVDFIFIHQNMGDGGCAVGAAMSVLHEREQKPYQNYQPNHVYFGPSYSDDQIEKALTKNNISYQKFSNIEEEIAKCMHQGKVVGRFNGGMEYGPRALGNRSLLASPTDKSINDWLNKKLNRTEFMPFAPSVIEEYAPDLFERYHTVGAKHASHFMTITYDVKPEWRQKMQATTHIDGTARPQVVRKEDNPSYHKIIEEYYKLSGIPGIINTSFNMHEEPIVTTPEDAIRAFEKGAFDYLAIGNFLCPPQENESHSTQ